MPAEAAAIGEKEIAIRLRARFDWGPLARCAGTTYRPIASSRSSMRDLGRNAMRAFDIDMSNQISTARPD
jgi:hypothetical protein